MACNFILYNSCTFAVLNMTRKLVDMLLGEHDSKIGGNVAR